MDKMQSFFITKVTIRWDEAKNASQEPKKGGQHQH
jgi:hypothetical protein